jgi:diacylglycerol kinase (CTP)
MSKPQQHLESDMPLSPNPFYPQRNEYHWPRRLFHMISGVLVVILSFLVTDKKDLILILVLGTLFELSFEYLRLYWKPMGHFVARVMGNLMRSGEELRLSGIPYYALGVTLSFLLFPRPIAILAVLFLAFGDPVASIAARYFKSQGQCREILPDRSWAGTLSAASICFLICFGMSFILFDQHLFQVGERLLFAAVGGFCAAIGESLPLRTDDNLSLPLVSGSLLWLYASFTGLVPGLLI